MFETQYDALGCAHMEWLSEIRSALTWPTGLDALGDVRAGELPIEGPLKVTRGDCDIFGCPTSCEIGMPGRDREVTYLVLSIRFSHHQLERGSFLVFALCLEKLPGSDNLFKRVGLYCEDMYDIEGTRALIKAMERRCLRIR